MEGLWCPHHHYGGNRLWLSSALQGKLHSASSALLTMFSSLTLFSQLMFLQNLLDVFHFASDLSVLLLTEITFKLVGLESTAVYDELCC